jgi:glutaminyl-peptide cyclotransferase
MPNASTTTRNASSQKAEAITAGSGSRALFVALLAVVAVILVIAAGYRLWNGAPNKAMAATNWNVPAKFDAARAFGYLERIVAFGPRPSGSPAMRDQQAFLKQFFETQGCEVEMQTFDHRHPETGERVEMVNVIARFQPDAKNRYLICAHYDTRPFPDSDRSDPKGVFVGANDGGSGAAALMEFSHHLSDLPATVGVDLVLFDGEELVYQSDRDPYFIGSTYFANQYVIEQKNADARRPYIAGVLLDMIGDRELQLYYERNSWNYAREVTLEVWSTAKQLGITAFQPRIRHLVRDDHLPLNTIAKIPTTDLIDFDYPRPGLRQQSYWHTTEDTVDKCSGESIVAVIYVLHTWLSSKR